jgi:hypothetical protein
MKADGSERVGDEAAQCLVNRCVQVHTCLCHLSFLEWCVVFGSCNSPTMAAPMEGIAGIGDKLRA